MLNDGTKTKSEMSFSHKDEHFIFILNQEYKCQNKIARDGIK